MHSLGLFAAVSLAPGRRGLACRAAVDSTAPPSPGTVTRGLDVVPGGARGGALPLVVATVRALSHGWMAIGDNGLILLRAQDVATAPPAARHVDVGVSRPRAAINNPGPLWFDVLAPFVEAAAERRLRGGGDGGDIWPRSSARPGRRSGPAASGPWS